MRKNPKVEMKGGLHESCWMVISVWHFETSRHPCSCFGGAKGGLSLTEEIGKGFRGAVKPVMLFITFLQNIKIQSCSAGGKNLLITLSLLRIHFRLLMWAAPQPPLPGFRVAVSSDADTRRRFVSGRDACLGEVDYY